MTPVLYFYGYVIVALFVILIVMIVLAQPMTPEEIAYADWVNAVEAEMARKP